MAATTQAKSHPKVFSDVFSKTTCAKVKIFIEQSEEATLVCNPDFQSATPHGTPTAVKIEPFSFQTLQGGTG